MMLVRSGTGEHHFVAHHIIRTYFRDEWKIVSGMTGAHHHDARSIVEQFPDFGGGAVSDDADSAAGPSMGL